MMEWMADPAIWFSLLTLVTLEIVLGIDNLVFIAILANKLPPEQRDKARMVGLSLALVMRLGLLASISWIMSLTATLFTAFGSDFSWRDIILIVGGAFLLVKATIEIHDRLEEQSHGPSESQGYAAFWPVIAQIVVLDAVFSIDSVITAIGMVDQLPVMMAAVIIAVVVMMVASKPLTRFMNSNPSLVILCLGFLMMIGLVLLVDGFGFHIPKGYVYAAIGFSIMIESLNHLGIRKQKKRHAAVPRRQSVASAVLRLLGGVPITNASEHQDSSASVLAELADEGVFTPTEKHMVQEVLALASRPVQTIMTPRRKIEWIDADAPAEVILASVQKSLYRQLVVSRGSVEEVAGIARKEDVLALFLSGETFELQPALRPAKAVLESASILDALNLFKGTPIDMALVVDEYGSLQGVVTQTDLLEAIAGDLTDTEKYAPEMRKLPDGAYEVDGSMAMYQAQTQLGLVDLPEGDFNTMAGLVLFLFERIPGQGERISWEDWDFEVSAMDGWRIAKILVRRKNPGASE